MTVPSTFLDCLRAGLVLSLFAMATSAAAQVGDPAERPQNVIVMIVDGGGPSTITMARDYLRDREGREELNLDDILVGTVRTYATDSRVTDSAAGATAFSTGVKTYNGAIAVDPERAPLGTLLEAARAKGMTTGLVATSRITHATPASFVAHVPDRWQENEIAAQLLDQQVDVVFGGGLRHFVPENMQGQRTDGRNLLQEAEESGYQVLEDRAAFNDFVELPVLGLFSRSHMDYEVDRDPGEQPHVAEMTRRAIDLLDGQPGGFFLMVEGSRVDHAGHNNDPAAMLYDMLAYDEAVGAALEFARNDGQTLVISVADHETGGLSLGRNIDGSGVYDWKPEVLARVQSSLGQMVNRIRTENASPEQVLQEEAGIQDLSPSEKRQLAAERDVPNALQFVLSDIISRRAVLGWTTKGHTGVDVHLYAEGPGSDRFRGHHDNTYVGRILGQLMDVNLEQVTNTVREQYAPVGVTTEQE